jgi:uroporphyrin-III C-methyltransferase
MLMHEIADHARRGVAGEPAPRPGKVYLVGAGPGAVDLITVKALRCLRAADVVIYDRLIDPALLTEARADATRIYAGKGPRCHTLDQAAINTLLVTHARQGQIVTRLKGGDPFIFGRGGEEALALVAANIPFEVVPGITAAIAVPAYAGIPVTQRGQSSAVTIVTGHEGSAINWEALAHLGGTIVIMMGVAALPAITARLLAAGLAPTTPAAVIQQGTTTSQRVVSGDVAAIATLAATAGLTSPAVTVVGAVASLHATLAWFAGEEMARPHPPAPSPS